jgi:hypothetical protein
MNPPPEKRMKPRFFNRIVMAIASVFAAITGKNTLAGKPINLANAMGLGNAMAHPVFNGGGNISIRRACRITNQRKRRKHFRAQIANGSIR